jgi:hypothetical protein
LGNRIQTRDGGRCRQRCSCISLNHSWLSQSKHH